MYWHITWLLGVRHYGVLLHQLMSLMLNEGHHTILAGQGIFLALDVRDLRILLTQDSLAWFNVGNGTVLLEQTPPGQI